MKKVLVGIITFRRPRMLHNLLESICNQQLAGSGIDFRVLVVDNDAAGSALGVVRPFLGNTHPAILHEVEPRRGIPFARNRVLERAMDLAVDYVAFIDDDEAADPTWLMELTNALEKFDADAVQGPVRYIAEPGGSDWMAEELDWRSRRMLRQKDGAVKAKLSTRNVLFSTRLPRDLGLRFDERYALSGGSDIDFFQRAHDLGAKTVWTNAAVVQERIPLERQTLGHQIRRAYRSAAGTTYSRRINNGFLKTMLRVLPKGLWRLIDGAVRLTIFGLVSPRRRLYALRRLAGGVGHFTGLFGLLGSQYESIQGH